MNCEDAIVDICFIHGLSGSCDSTWIYKSKRYLGQKEFLSQIDIFKQARLLTFGYDAYMVRLASGGSSGIFVNCLHGHANDLLLDLFQEWKKSPDRPLIELN
mgnify:CR=1 FL=1